jgi:hypothetical protein
MSRVWTTEASHQKSALVVRADEITKHLNCTYKIHERTVRVDGESIKVFVLVVRTDP